jgi:D-alanyl-lipoteichoic acid acyltransferase DltB (MBOAT superfamily)
MLFNSIEFAIFLPLVFFLHWFVARENRRHQNLLLLIVSYIFYGWWSWKFLGLLLLSTLIDYFFGFWVASPNPKRGKLFLWLSIFNNLIVLGIFKYYNFFVTEAQALLESIGLHTHPYILQVALPVGISFYTFHGMSYVFDIYKSNFKPIKNFIDYAVFVSFFPLLVAGPIERAAHLLPQFMKPRKFDLGQATDGMRQILWGLFKKMVIADNCASYANDVFAHCDTYWSSTLVFGALFFAVQIYCDFSGYSDIALGTAKLFGIDLLRNFAFPYFSRDIAEFWRRWHISLSSWFRDYVYIPLGGSKGSTWLRVRNTFIIFLLSGFWHGANWTFIFWGLIHACCFLPLLLANKNRKNITIVAENKLLPSAKELIQMVGTFAVVVLAWVFFRAESIGQAFIYIRNIFSKTLMRPPQDGPYLVMVLIAILFLVEWVQRDKHHALQFSSLKMPTWTRWSIYYVLIALIMTFGGSQQSFIYFQF